MHLAMMCVWVLSCSVGSVPSADAKDAMTALNRAYWDATQHCFRKTPAADSKPLDFWMTAHVWECVMDAYERHGDAQYKEQIGQVYDGFIEAHPDWQTNPYNDDVMWWTIACVRAYGITREERYLTKARSEFDRLYGSQVDAALGGGMWWRNDSHRSKNACVNGPAAITALDLALALKDETYADKARSLYAWERATLFDPNTGAVYDNANTRGRVSRRLFTYNQGTFIGAALRLYRRTEDTHYLADAVLAADCMRQRLCNQDGILKSEGQGDAGTFKLIGVRYLVELAQTTQRKDLFDWLEKNADTAWRNRRVSDNIMGFDWSRPVSDEEVIQCQSAAAGVVLLNLLK
ncbi:MAG: glycoside hydrolase family 76 protein [Sedimentisphaerales bacterium]|nr:glycoside hydrolase family 76 protein [Sedimentisphaerales bacterium]